MHNILTFSTFLSEGAARLSAKTAALKGPLHELLVGKHLNQGNFPEDYRVEGKKPEDGYNMWSERIGRKAARKANKK